MEYFYDWLANELNKRGLSPSDLARMMNKAPAVVTRVLNGQRSPSPETVEAIARALGYPPEVVFRAAGLLPPTNPRSEQIERILNYLDKLPESNLDAIEIQLAALASHVKPPKAGKTGPLGGGR